MSENFKQNDPANEQQNQPEILVNDYGAAKDNAVVVDESDRTVLLTPDETIVIEKEPAIDVVPRNRPRKVYLGMWGPTEIATVGVGLLAILATLLVYIFLVVPSDRELAHNREERDRLEKELASANSKYGSITDTQTQVNKLVQSVEDFQLNYLPAAANGKYALYERLNGLITSYGLVNTSGPDYAPLEDDGKDNGQQSDDSSRGRAKFKSLFPGVYVTMTVEGSYANLRHFINDIEAGQEFVVISSIKLQPSENKQSSPAVPAPEMNVGQTAMAANPQAGQFQGGIPGMQGPNPGGVITQQPRQRVGKTHGELVSLRLEMAAYFRRPDFVMSTSQAAQ
jgi:Tfp pilus assembly protein PilO